MKPNTMRKFAKSMLAGALSLAAGSVFAQAYPNKPVRVIVPYPPATGVDIITRHVLDEVAKSTKQPFIYETRTGANGTIAVNYVAKLQPPDGYTIVTNSAAHSIVPSTMKEVPYDTAKDLAGITTLADLTLVLIVSKDLGVKTVKELVAAAKAKNGGFSFASGGVGSTAHLAAEKIRLAAGFQATHIPLNSRDGVPDVMGGRIQFMYTSIATAMGGISSGSLIPLAVSNKRSSAIPNVPTIEEAGIPDGGFAVWLGIFGPAKMPREAVNRIYQEVVKAHASADLKERLAKVGAEPLATAPDAFDAQVRKELVDYARIAKALGLEPQ